jgi:hypothetical protein
MTAVEQKTIKVRKRVVVEEDVIDAKDPKQYEPVTFIFFNEEQRGQQVPYDWQDRWIKAGQCKGIFYDGQRYTLPRIVYEYYKNQCSMPKYTNTDKEIVPGLTSRVSTETGRDYRFRMEEIK